MKLLPLGLLFAANASLADVSPAPDRASPPAPPASIWRSDESGALQHLQSGLVCPPTLGAYKRSDTMVFDGFGLDVGCNYKAETSDITVYLTRRNDGGGVDPAMAEAQRELLQVGAARHPRPLSTVASTMGGLGWASVLYSEDGGLRSSIWIADLSGWTLEYRATYRENDESRVAADLAAMTATVTGSAGARLALCAKSSPPSRNASAISDKRDLNHASLMTSILGGASVAAAQESQARPSAPVVWCFEAPVLEKGYRMLYWRAVNNDGTDARSDEISLVTDRPPPTLLVDPDSMAGLVERSLHGAAKAARWVATSEDGGRTLIFGYFDGRPSRDALAGLFERTLAGKAKPIGGYAAKGKNITIVVPPGP